MAERLALGVIPGVGWSAEEIQTIAREAEEAGFDAIFAAEVNNDVMRPRNSWAPRPAASRWGPGSPTSICATRTSVRKARHSSPMRLVAKSPDIHPDVAKNPIPEITCRNQHGHHILSPCREHGIRRSPDRRRFEAA